MSETKQQHTLRVLWVLQKVIQVDYSVDEIKDMLEAAGYEREDGKVPDTRTLRDILNNAISEDIDATIGDEGPNADDYKPFLAAADFTDSDFESSSKDEENSDGE